MKVLYHYVNIILIILILQFCANGAGQSQKNGIGFKDESANLYDPQRIIEVRIKIDEKDWDSLRKERHNIVSALGPQRIQQPEPDPYNIYRAEVTIDGVVFKDVGIKKRGFLGSSSFTRPSLGIWFDEYDKNLRYCGKKRLSLNNNLQDPSLVHQFLAYKIFREAGVAAPECNFARVYVNDKYLGIYSNVEPIDSEFLKKNFGDASGSLYEGQLSDFREEWDRTFEKKNKKKTNSIADIEAVSLALKASDEELLDRLKQVVDVEEYLTFLAVEVLIGHWDSYSNNGNNFFIYKNPATGKFVFIPWGADATFGEIDPFNFDKKKNPRSVYAGTIIPYRLYQIKETRERYRDRLRGLLNSVWDEDKILSEIDRLENLLKPHLHLSYKDFKAALDKTRDYIRMRRKDLQNELQGEAPELVLPMKKAPYLVKTGKMLAEFKTTYKGLPSTDSTFRQSVNLRMTLNGRRQWFGATGLSFAPAKDPRCPDFPALTFYAFELIGGKVLVPIIIIQPELFGREKRLTIDGTGVVGILIEGQILEFRIKAPNVLSGTLTFEELDVKPGGIITGKIEADIYSLLQ